MKKEIFTVEEVADLLKKSKKQIHYRIRKGYLEAYKLPGERSYIITREKLSSYLDSGKIELEKLEKQREEEKQAINLASPLNESTYTSIDDDEDEFALPEDLEYL